MYKLLSACRWSGLTRRFIYTSKAILYLSPTTSLLSPPKIAVILNVYYHRFFNIYFYLVSYLHQILVVTCGTFGCIYGI